MGAVLGDEVGGEKLSLGPGRKGDEGQQRLPLDLEKSCKYMQKTMQMSPAGSWWEEDPAGDFVPKVWSRATCSRITWGTHSSPWPPPDLLLPSPGAAAQESMFKELPR